LFGSISRSLIAIDSMSGASVTGSQVVVDEQQLRVRQTPPPSVAANATKELGSPAMDGCGATTMSLTRPPLMSTPSCNGSGPSGVKRDGSSALALFSSRCSPRGSAAGTRESVARAASHQAGSKRPVG
jgi:hypothetical protein